MPKYDYEIAMEKLSDSDKNRCLAAYFSMDNANAHTNWAVATKSFGAASENSMRTMVGSAMKKIRDNGGEYNADGSRIPATAKKAGGRKPKNDQGENDDEDGDSYEIKKGGGGRKRAAADDGKVTRNVEGKKPIKRARGKKVVEDVKPEDEADAIPGTDKDADIADNIVVKTETQVEDEDEDEQV